MTIGMRARQRRVELNLTQIEVAERAGITQQSYQKIEEGKTKNPRKLLDLAQALACDPNWLTTGNAAKINITENHCPLLTINDLRDYSTRINTTIYPCPVKCSTESFVLNVQGISMEPIFMDGDLIFVDPKEQFGHGSYVIARLQATKEILFKQLIIEAEHRYLKSLNTNWPNQIICMDENDSIIGVVIFSGRKTLK